MLRNCEGEALVQGQSDGLGPVPWLMNLETDVEVLSSQKVGPSIWSASCLCCSRSLNEAMRRLICSQLLTGQEVKRNLKLR